MVWVGEDREGQKQVCAITKWTIALAHSWSAAFYRCSSHNCSKYPSDARGRRHGQPTPESYAKCADHHSCPTRACSQSAEKCQQHERRYRYEGDQSICRGDGCD